MRNKHCLLFFLTVLFFLLGSGICLAITLEVSYPQLPSGDTITSTTPLTIYLKYFFNLGVLVGFLAVFISLIWGGFLYITSAVSPEKKSNAKKQILSGVSGLLILLLSYLIIITINPQLSFFTSSPTEKTPGVYLVSSNDRKPLLLNVPDTSKVNPPFTNIEYICSAPSDPELIVSFFSQLNYVNLLQEVSISCGGNTLIIGRSFTFRHNEPGFYLFKQKNCRGETLMRQSGDFPDLGEFSNQVQSVKIVQKPPEIYNIAFLYDFPNFRGRCYYVNPNTVCDNLSQPTTNPFSPIASSMSIYQYDAKPLENPNNKGVTFYRKSFFNDAGGWKKINSTTINGGYMKLLKDLWFNNVPKEEQDCTKWSFITGRPENNYCIEWGFPNLTKENISSIKIEGDYLVILIYYDYSTGGWSSCQIFPTAGDTDREGPKQIKWDYIRQTGLYPNYVWILPIRML